MEHRARMWTMPENRVKLWELENKKKDIIENKKWMKRESLYNDK